MKYGSHFPARCRSDLHDVVVIGVKLGHSLRESYRSQHPRQRTAATSTELRALGNADKSIAILSPLWEMKYEVSREQHTDNKEHGKGPRP